MPDIPTVFDTCKPRDDVLKGTLEEEQFAAKLASVVFNPDDAAEVYSDPGAFFASTYPTGGLQSLLTNLVSRFLVPTGHEAEFKSSILCLDTSFGGGKTHDLIAAHHLATSPSEIENLGAYLREEYDELAGTYQEAIEEGLQVRTATLVGGFIDARNARSDADDPDAPNTNTLWGEMAYQLYGNEGYELLKEHDRDRNAPGENTLRQLFDLSDDPALILVDEIAKYLEDASAVEVGGTTLATQTVSFLQALLETAASMDNLTLVYSIADTAFTDEAETVRKDIRDLDAIESRKQRVITPTGDDEVSHVLKNRLFKDVDESAAEEVAQAYSSFYNRTDRTLPQSTQEPAYRGRLERHYPFHPTIIETLTEKVDSIQDFQRTRGALRLVARAIHHLWKRPFSADHNRHWLRLYDLTPADDDPSGSIRGMLGATLFDHVDLESAVKADIYNSDSTAHAQLEDDKWTEKGHPPLGTHLTTTVLWHSLAVGEQAVGITRGQLYEAIGHPDVLFDHYDSSLEDLTGDDLNVACHFLYDENRIKFKSEANLIRVIDDYTEDVEREQARARFETRLKGEIGTGGFQTEIFPEAPADLPDQAHDPTIAVLHFDTVQVSDGGQTVPDRIQDLYEHTATSRDSPQEDRSYRNYVLFVAPDEGLVDPAIQVAQRLQGMEDLQEEANRNADLSEDQLEDLRDRRDKAYGLLGERVRAAYRHLFYPEQSQLEHFTITAVDSNGDTKIVEAVQTTLEDRILRDDSGPRGVAWFKAKLWQQTKDRMSTEDLRRQFARKPGLPFLLTTRPLRETVVRIVEEADYAYWDGHRGLAFWSGDEDPDGWPYDEPVAASTNVEASIASSDVKIGDDFIVYEDFEALYEQQEIDPPASECSDCGATVQDPTGEPPYLCEDCKETVECRECGKEIQAPEPGPGGPICSECQDEESGWDHTTDRMSATRSIRETRERAAAASRGGKSAAARLLVIKVHGDTKLKHARFLARQLEHDDEDIHVHLDYRAESPTGSEFQANFRGTLKDFLKVSEAPEEFTEDANQRSIDLSLRIDFPEPRLLDGEDSPLADLDERLEGTNLTLQIQAQGPLLDPSEVSR